MKSIILIQPINYGGADKNIPEEKFDSHVVDSTTIKLLS